MLFNNIPDRLKTIPQWVVYKNVTTKLPLQINGKNARVNDPATWCSFAEARTAVESGAFIGAGFVFTPDCGCTGIDLDNAFEPGGITDWALKLVCRFESYTEISVSGKGLHIIVGGAKPGTKCKRAIADGEIELYDHNRYFAMTGKLYDQSLRDVKPRQDLLTKLYFQLFPKPPVPEIGADDDEPRLPVPPIQERITTQQVCEIIENSSQAEKFRSLTGGFETAIGLYGNDHSRAIYALTGLLAFYTDDFTIVDSIVRGASLFTGKWAANKWSRLGEEQFHQQRMRLESSGKIYGAGNADDAATEFAEGPDKAIAKAVNGKDKAAREYEAHVQLLQEMFPDLRRCLLSDSLYGRREKGRGKWLPVFTRSIISAIKGECQRRGPRYKPSKVENYLYRYEAELPAKLLIDLPDWDGKDRIGEMCSKLRFESTQSADIFLDIFKDWCASLWKKIERPTESQNRCLILSGDQGIGKDVWVASCFCALEDYLADLTFRGKYTKEDDIAVVMSSSIVLFISEFDKTHDLGVAALKDLVTKGSFKFVRKYDRDATQLLNRCSIIAAANPTSLLRDTTGNRRFLVFRLAGGPGQAIKWDYPTNDKPYSAQILAQSYELYRAGYKSMALSENVIAEAVRAATPDDLNAELLVEFEAAVECRMKQDPLLTSALFPLADIDGVLSSLSRIYGTPRTHILSLLKSSGCQYRTSGARMYGTRIAVIQAKQNKEKGKLWNDERGSALQ